MLRNRIAASKGEDAAIATCAQNFQAFFPSVVYQSYKLSLRHRRAATKQVNPGA
jgi:hypothetical protein